MSDMETVRKEARRRVLDSKQWGATCETAILTGAWDTGALVMEAEAEVLKDRPEADDE